MGLSSILYGVSVRTHGYGGRFTPLSLSRSLDLSISTPLTLCLAYPTSKSKAKATKV